VCSKCHRPQGGPAPPRSLAGVAGAIWTLLNQKAGDRLCSRQLPDPDGVSIGLWWAIPSIQGASTAPTVSVHAADFLLTLWIRSWNNYIVKGENIKRNASVRLQFPWQNRYSPFTDVLKGDLEHNPNTLYLLSCTYLLPSWAHSKRHFICLFVFPF
jgi:hypothetical protein